MCKYVKITWIHSKLYLYVILFHIDIGIGQGRVTSNLQGAPIDDAVFIMDKEALEMVGIKKILSFSNFWLFLN